MKKHIISALAAIAAVALTGCDSLLDDNRMPLDVQTDNPEYWNAELNVQYQCDQMYSNFLGYGLTTSWVNNYYYRSLNDDQSAIWQSGSGAVFPVWTWQQTPSNNSTWDDDYKMLRHVNTIIEKLEASTLPAATRNNYMGIARLVRAMQYYDLVQNFGDVPYVTEPLDPTSGELQAKRTPRNEVMDRTLEDLNFACTNIKTQRAAQAWSKDLAQAVKAEICLYEASMARYHQHNEARAKSFYTEVVNACQDLMSRYSVCNDYKSIFNTLGLALANNPEIIFMKGYQTGMMCHSMIDFLSAETIMGMNKDAFDSFLFKDGKPLATTTCNKSDRAVVREENGRYVLDISADLAQRDDRLGWTIDPQLSFNGCTIQRHNDAGAVSSSEIFSNTGYTINKFINPTTGYQENITANQGYTSAPLYWISVIYCEFAEAKAELGTLNDGDLAMSLNKLYRRAGLPEQTVAGLSAINDPANNMNVSSLIWEVRRCRRCETMFCCNFRYWDLVRWHQLELMDTQNYPNIMLGANLAGVPSDITGGVTLSNDYIDASATANGRQVRKFAQREYLMPIGKRQLELNPNLTQNPGW